MRTGRDGSQREARIGAQWMLSFADLVTLITAFFVLQIAMTTIEPGAWDGIRDGLAGRFAIAEPSVPGLPPAASLDRRYIEGILARIAATPPMAGAQAGSLGHHAVLVLPPEPRPALEAALPSLAALPNPLTVVAVVAPDEPAASAIARAQAVGLQLEAGGKPPASLAAIGPRPGLVAGSLVLAFDGAVP